MNTTLKSFKIFTGFFWKRMWSLYFSRGASVGASEAERGQATLNPMVCSGTQEGTKESCANRAKSKQGKKAMQGRGRKTLSLLYSETPPVRFNQPKDTTPSSRTWRRPRPTERFLAFSQITSPTFSHWITTLTMFFYKPLCFTIWHPWEVTIKVNLFWAKFLKGEDLDWIVILSLRYYKFKSFSQWHDLWFKI